jgi:integrase
MATVTKRATGYQVQIRRKGYPNVSRMFDTKRDAEAWARQQESEMDRAVFVDRSEAERTTLADLLQRYLREVTPTKKSAVTEQGRIERLLKQEALCKYRLSALTPQLVAEFRDRRRSQVSGSSTNRDLSIISHTINTAIREWSIPLTNPVSLIRKPKENAARERRFHPGELDRLMRAIEAKSSNPWLAPIITFAIETGMRRGEMLSLRWSDVNLERRVLRLVDTKNGEGRSVPLTTRATGLLYVLPKSIDGRVFPTSAQALEQAFRRAVVRAEINDLHFHDLRHEAVSRLFEKGLNVMEVASISGHKTIQMLKRYTHLSSDQLLAKIG